MHVLHKNKEMLHSWPQRLHCSSNQFHRGTKQELLCTMLLARSWQSELCVASAQKPLVHLSSTPHYIILQWISVCIFKTQCGCSTLASGSQLICKRQKPSWGGLNAVTTNEPWQKFDARCQKAFPALRVGFPANRVLRRQSTDRTASWTRVPSVTCPACLASHLQRPSIKFQWVLSGFEGGVGAPAFSLVFGLLSAAFLPTACFGCSTSHHASLQSRRWHSLWCKAKWLSCLCETEEPTQWDNTAKYENLQTPNLLLRLLSVDYSQQRGQDGTRDIKWRHSTPHVQPLGSFWLQK